jgi:hypothetical protein
MFGANRFAFKNWAVTCKALATGRQSLLLRKGGISERGGRFEVEHREFWLFPTRFHQSPHEIRDNARDLMTQVTNDAPAPGLVNLSLYAVVEDVIELTDESRLARLAELQILAQHTLVDRFRYRRPTLFVLPARIYRREQSITIVDTPQFAGCRTWVELGEAQSTEGLTPILSDRMHADCMKAIRSALW